MHIKRTLALIAAVTLGACRQEPVDTQTLLTAHSVGLVFLQRDQLAEAEEQFKEVVRLAPSDPLGHANLGLTYLRGGRFDEAKNALDRARKLDRNNPEVALTLARLFSLTNRPDEARALLRTLANDARALYALAELDSAAAARGDRSAGPRRRETLGRLLQAAPANTAARLAVAEALLQQGQLDSAAGHLEEIRRTSAEPPREVRSALDSTILLLRSGDLTAARATFRRTSAALELTAPYQASLQEVRWVQGTLLGRPTLAFKPQTLITTRGLLVDGAAVAVQYIDVTGDVGFAAGTPTALALGDYDGDGMDNLFVASQGPDGTPAPPRLYHMRGGFLADVTQRAGLTLPAGVRHALFADFDNDRWLDLFAIGQDDRGYLLRNTGTGAFRDATNAARIGDTGGATGALSVDVDHDGDLDLLLTGGATLRVLRNNMDGSFTEIAAALGLHGAVQDAAFADFNGDGRVDLVAIGADGDRVFLNAGVEGFTATALGDGGLRGGRIAVGDYDNDGAHDVAVGRADGTVTLYRNDGRGAFAADSRSPRPGSSRAGKAVAPHFVDYDNDGWLDLVVAGGGTLLGYHNDSSRFAPRPRVFAGPRPGTDGVPLVGVTDVDDDGDQDLFVGDPSGLRMFRNDGGNARMAMQVQLTGLRTGSGKNNTFGIGSHIEVRAGKIYQSRVVTGGVTHFGLGPHLKADVLRVQWTNGVPQTLYFPGTDADIVELEQLKGSCGFLYTWDGTRFRFVTDVMWRSALGMPLGIMGATGAAYAPAGASQEYLRIPGDALRPRHGRYVLQFTEELWETAYLDEIRLIAVDHPDSVEIVVDEKFVPPGPIQLRLYQVARRAAPRSAADGRGMNVLPALERHDYVYVSNLTPSSYQGVVEPHELVMDLDTDAGRPGSYLFLRGWIYPTDASINVALGQQTMLQPAMPTLEVRNARGEWQTVAANIGFPSGKDKTIVVDLAGKFPTNDRHVRIRTNMQIYWDQAYVGIDAAHDSVRARNVPLLAADLHFRGFSRMYRKGGRHGPHWFDYADVRAESPWRPIEGAFTRYGNVLPLLGDSDDRYVVMAPGDEATVEFDARAVGAPRPGWRRTFLLYTDGWIKDADMNTAHGNTVEPLPYHAIGRYPYGPGDAYPTDSARQRYLREYNTRVIRR